MTAHDPYRAAGYDRVPLCAFRDCRQPADNSVEAYWVRRPRL